MNQDNQIVIQVNPQIMSNREVTIDRNIIKRNTCQKLLKNFNGLPIQIKIIIVLIILIILGFLGFVIFASSEFIRVFS
jgi:hypothetical protein